MNTHRCMPIVCTQAHTGNNPLLTCRRIGLQFWCSACTWRSSTSGTCSGSAPLSGPCTGHNHGRSTSAHTRPFPPRSCCKGAPPCPGILWFGFSGSSLDWARCTPGRGSWERWTCCASAPSFHVSWASWQQRCRTSPSVHRPPYGSQPAAASKSWGCRILIPRGTYRTRGQGLTPSERERKETTGLRTRWRTCKNIYSYVATCRSMSKWHMLHISNLICLQNIFAQCAAHDHKASLCHKKTEWYCPCLQ